VEIERAKRHNKPLAFAMIDLDYFKNVNDNYGHLVGDNVIRSLAQLLQKSLRRLDVVGRYGGEEFGVIFPETTGVAAFQVIDKVRQTFAKIKHHSADHRWYFEVTFSAGVVEVDTQHDASTLFDHADKVLYSAKSGGRNRVKRH
jgi:diguanylate cyclase (GGDEF)-like protein